MARRRTYKKYDVIVGGKIVHSGITTNLERRKQEHKAKWPKATIRQVGGPVIRKSAIKWESTKKKA